MPIKAPATSISIGRWFNIFVFLLTFQEDLAMEKQNRMLTVEDILSIHRKWITQLFIEHEHTQAEIVDILAERHIFC